MNPLNESSSTSCFIPPITYDSISVSCGAFCKPRLLNQCFVHGSGLFAHTFNKGSSSSALKFYQLPSSNLTTGNFIGFASAGVSNGQTVTVKVTGNTLTTSGLTPGIQYFVGGDGALSTTAYSEAEVKAGIALASNKLLIRQ